jgi:hypothetical protein
LVRLHRTFYKKTKNFDLWNSLGKYLLIFKKKVQLSFIFGFQRLTFLLDAPKNWFQKKWYDLPNRSDVFFLNLLFISNISLQNFNNKLFLIKYCMLLILYFKIIFNFYKISKINEENYKKINSVFKRPMFILFKYYYCFQRDTFIPQSHELTVFIFWLRSIKTFDVGLNVLVQKARPYPIVLLEILKKFGPRGWHFLKYFL